jgi:hypothetical protein
MGYLLSTGMKGVCRKHCFWKDGWFTFLQITIILNSNHIMYTIFEGHFRNYPQPFCLNNAGAANLAASVHHRCCAYRMRQRSLRYCMADWFNISFFDRNKLHGRQYPLSFTRFPRNGNKILHLLNVK